MNGDVKVLDQNPTSAPVSGNVAQPQMGSLNKEVPVATTGLPEVQRVGPEAEHNINQELKDLGVKEIRDGPDLTQAPNVQHAGSHVPVPSSPSGQVTMPMSEEEIADQLKTGQDDDSGKWLARLIRKIIDWGLKAR